MTAIHNGVTGENYYAKPSPVAAGAWDADDIALTVNPNLSSQFTFTNDPEVAYDIYRRAGVNPANTDEIVATVSVSAQAAAATAITAAGLVPKLTGPYTRTITVIDDDTDDEIEGALVRLSRTGETETQTTDTDGEVEFTTGAYTFTIAVTAAGYSGSSQSLVISESGSTTVRLDPSSIVLPSNPALAALPIRCLDESGDPEEGVVVYGRIVSIPASSTGISFDGASQSDTSDSNGDASLTVVKGATYEIRRGVSAQWHKRVMTTDDVQVPMSFIGVDPIG
jgi:hypothetical protein